MGGCEGMELAIISDVHSNLHALKAVMEKLKGYKVLCCGDLVGYGAFPNEVVETIMREGIPSILGNHDYAAFTGDTTWFNPIAAEAMVWTRDRLKEDNLAFLRELPREHSNELALFHGSPIDLLNDYVYPDAGDSYLEGFFDVVKKEILVLGHTHVPFVRELKGKLLFNPGSVGQPRDLDPRAAYAILDTEKRKVEIFRTEYDVKGAAKAIVEAGLPTQLGERLHSGW